MEFAKDKEQEFMIIEGTIKRRTEKAILVDVGGVEEWLPLSQIEDLDESANGEFTCTIPAWLYEKKGFD